MIANVSTKALPAATAWESLVASWVGIANWFEEHWGDIAAASIAALAIFGVLWGLRWLARRRGDEAPLDPTLTDVFRRAFARTGTIALALFSICVAVPYTNPPGGVRGLVAILLTAVLALQGAAWLRDILIGIIRRRAADGHNETLTNAMVIIRLLISVTLFAIAAIIILSNIGVNVSGLLAGLGIGGIAIGLAAQGIFADLFAALSIIFDRPFSNGETIRYDQTTATVERVGLKSTRLRSINGELLIISNTNLLNKEIGNFARLERRRVNFRLLVQHDTPPDKLRALSSLLEKTVTDAGHHFIRSGLFAFTPAGLEFELIFDVMSENLDVVASARTTVGIAVAEALQQGGFVMASAPAPAAPAVAVKS